MSKIDEGSADLGPLEEQAHAWVRLLASGSPTAADAQALQRWCAQSPAHAAAFFDASQFWQAIGPAGRSLISDEKAATRHQRAKGLRTPIGRRAVLGGALAASATGVMIARPPFGLWPSIAELRADYRTEAGEQRQLALTDGIDVQLNSRTSISVGTGAYSGAIELIAGEAYFAPASQHRSKPFSVLAAGGTVSATDGRFELRLLTSGACVTCLEDEATLKYRGQVTRLLASQRVSYGSEGVAAAVTIDPIVASAWRRGVMIFNMTPLSEVIEELNRYRAGRIILLNSRVARAPVNAQFKIDKPDEALMQIERAFDVQGRALPGGIVLLS